MEVESTKKMVLKFAKTFSVVLGTSASIVTIAISTSPLSQWFLVCFAIFLSFTTACLFYLYIDKSKCFRRLFSYQANIMQIFDKTHNSWHSYKRLSDSMHKGFDLDEFRLQVVHSIANLINNFRQSMELLHPNEKFRISMKSISFKNLHKLDDVDGKTYVNEVFTLKDLPLFRDTAEGTVRQDEILTNLDFDPNTNALEYQNLKQTLFYECFKSKKVVFTNKFNEVQQTYTKKFKSGVVAPVVLHEIPFAFICIGSENENIFNKKDHDLICTFADSISEYIRIETICNSIAKSEKVVVMNNLQHLINNTSNQLDKDKLCDKRG